MSYLPSEWSTNADVSFHYFSGKSGSYYEYTTPTYLGAGVTRPTASSFVLSSGRSYWLRGVVSFVRGANSYNLLRMENQWELQGSLAGFKASIVSGISNASVVLEKNPTNRPEAEIFIPSSAISTSVTVAPLIKISSASDLISNKLPKLWETWLGTIIKRIQ